MSSIWKLSVVIPVPKRRSKGPCTCVTDDFSVCALQGNVHDCKGKAGSSSRRKEIGC